MPSYETLCVFHPELPETRMKELTTWMQTIVENGQGNLLKVENWGMRDLAYRIKKQRRGYYIRLEYDAEPAALNELERNLRLNEDVLRFLSVVRGEPLPATQSAPSPSATTPSSPAPPSTTPSPAEAVASALAPAAPALATEAPAAEAPTETESEPR